MPGHSELGAAVGALSLIDQGGESGCRLESAEFGGKGKAGRRGITRVRGLGSARLANCQDYERSPDQLRECQCL